MGIENYEKVNINFHPKIPSLERIEDKTKINIRYYPIIKIIIIKSIQPVKGKKIPSELGKNAISIQSRRGSSQRMLWLKVCKNEPKCVKNK